MAQQCKNSKYQDCGFDSTHLHGPRERSKCEGGQFSGFDPGGPVCPPNNPQSFDTSDDRAAKNIYLISAALFKCNNFLAARDKIAEYARQNGVNIQSIRNDDGKYEGQKRYAIAMVDAHAKISVASLCAAIVQDFGPKGKLASGLVAEKR